MPSHEQPDTARMEDSSLFQVLTAVGELKASLVGFSVETLATLRGVNARLDLINGSVGRHEQWKHQHDGEHDAAQVAAQHAADIQAGRKLERDRAVSVLQRGYEIGTHPVAFGGYAVVLVVMGWIAGVTR